MDKEYNPVQAKFCASLLWFVCRVSENGQRKNIPPEITSPIEITANNVLVIHPAVVNYLTSGEMYTSVGNIIFGQDIQSLWDLIQLVSRNGTYVMDEHEEAVTDLDLLEKFPFKLFSHLALMDSLMMLYLNSKVTVQNIVNVVRDFSTYNASRELPFDLEDALLLWINKINLSNKERSSNDANQSSRERKKVCPQVCNLNECLKDSNMWFSMLVFYFPDVNSLVGEVFNDVKSGKISEKKIANIELFRSVCAERICTSVFALRVEDFLVANETLKTNFMTLLCEMFHTLEVEKRMSQRAVHNIRMTTTKNNQNDEKQQQRIYNDSVKTSRSLHQPLLSKRSKQQITTFDSGKLNVVSPINNELHPCLDHVVDNVWFSCWFVIEFQGCTQSVYVDQFVSNQFSTSALTVDDFDMKQSYTIQSTANTYRCPDVSLAWGRTQPDENSKKEKITINFRSEQSDDISSYSKIEKMPESYDCSAAEFVSGMPESTGYEEKFEMSRDSQYRDTQFPSKNDEHFIDTSKQVGKSHTFFSCSPQKPHPAMQYVSAVSLVSSKNSSQIRHITQENGANIDQEAYIDNDALSTITEATEPEAPSLYSFNSSSSSTSTKCTEHSNERMFNDDEHLFCRNSKKYDNMEAVGFHPNVVKSFSPQATSANAIQHKLERTRGSYTVHRGTMETAVATGLPIITNSVKLSLNQPPTYVDIESKYGICNKQVDDKPNDLRHVISVENNSEFEDAPIHVASASSSHLSTDDGHAVSNTNELARPNDVIYSSLNEHTNAFPHSLNNDVRVSKIEEPHVQETSSMTLHDSPMQVRKDVSKVQREMFMGQHSGRVFRECSSISRNIDVKVSYDHWPFVKADHLQNKSTINLSNVALTTDTVITWFDLVHNKRKMDDPNLRMMFEQMQQRGKHGGKFVIMQWRDVVNGSTEDGSSYENFLLFSISSVIMLASVLESKV